MSLPARPDGREWTPAEAYALALALTLHRAAGPVAHALARDLAPAVDLESLEARASALLLSRPVVEAICGAISRAADAAGLPHDPALAWDCGAPWVLGWMLAGPVFRAAVARGAARVKAAALCERVAANMMEDHDGVEMRIMLSLVHREAFGGEVPRALNALDPEGGVATAIAEYEGASDEARANLPAAWRAAAERGPEALAAAWLEDGRQRQAAGIREVTSGAGLAGEDVRAQDVLADLVTGLHGERVLRAELGRARAALRGRRRRQRDDGGRDRADVVAEGPTTDREAAGLLPEEEAGRRELVELVRGAADKLTDRQRRVLVLRLDGERRTWPEVARELGCSERTARREEENALEQLRKALEQQE
ncbi:MAG: sigma-70 family RNA polymerase sigma factor [Planctomycetota bacterium]